MSITTIDSHKLLFGKKGIQDGNVIDMAEHGRVGGLSTGQPFKFTDSPNYDIKLIEDGSITYIGYAKPGTAEATEAWKVMKMDATTGLKMTWAGGAPEFLYAVTDMASLFA
jgi:hypothetical protein